SSATPTFVPAPPAAIAKPTTKNIFYCRNDVAVPLTATGTNIIWYTLPAGGIGSSQAPTPLTTDVGTITYFVSQSNGNCESPRADISVTINRIPEVYAGG